MTQRAQPQSDARQINLVAGLVLAIISLGCILWLIPTHVSSQTTPGDLPPTMMPYLSVTVVLILSVGLMLQAIRRRTREGVQVPGRVILIELLLATAATALVLAINNTLGFLVMSIALTGAAMTFAGGRSWAVIGIVSTMFPVLIWLGAWHVFTVQLP